MVLASQVLQVPAWVDLQVLEVAPLAHLEPGACLALQEAFRVGPGALLAASCLAVVGPLDPTLKPVLPAVARPAYGPAVLPPWLESEDSVAVGRDPSGSGPEPASPS